jgi:hypothetical protein
MIRDIITLMMGVANISDTSVKLKQTARARTQKADVFIVAAVRT